VSKSVAKGVITSKIKHAIKYKKTSPARLVQLLQPIFVQLSPTVTKLCHIECDHPACVSADGGHSEHIMVVALNIA